MVCSLSAMALFGLIDNFMRLAADTGSLWQFHLIRSIVALVVLYGAARVMKVGLRMQHPSRVAGRTFFAATAMVIYFGCLGVMPIAQAVAGLFTAPIFVVIFSVLFFGERVGARRIFAVLLGFAGIMLVLRPDAQGIGPLTILPIVAGAFHAMGNITTRRWCADEGTLTLLGAFFVAMLCIGAAGVVVMQVFVAQAPAGADGYVYRGWVPFAGAFMVITLIQGVGSLIGVGLIIRSYQLAESSFISVFENAMIVFATLWAVVLWGEVPSTVGVFGLALIVASGVIISVRSGQRTARPA